MVVVVVVVFTLTDRASTIYSNNIRDVVANPVRGHKEVPIVLLHCFWFVLTVFLVSLHGD